MQDHIQDDSYLVYKLVVHQAQLQRPTGYSNSHSFAKTQELMGATKTPPIKKPSFRGTNKLLRYPEKYFCDATTNFIMLNIMNTLPK